MKTLVKSSCNMLQDTSALLHQFAKPGSPDKVIVSQALRIVRAQQHMAISPAK